MPAQAVARLNTRCPEAHYTLPLTGNGSFKLRERRESIEKEVSEALPLYDFVSFVYALGPQVVRRVTRNDAAFAAQLNKKPKH